MDGVLLLVSVGDRKWHISAATASAFTDAGIQYLDEQMTPFMARWRLRRCIPHLCQWSDTYIDMPGRIPYDVNLRGRCLSCTCSLRWASALCWHGSSSA